MKQPNVRLFVLALVVATVAAAVVFAGLISADVAMSDGAVLALVSVGLLLVACGLAHQLLQPSTTALILLFAGTAPALAAALGAAVFGDGGSRFGALGAGLLVALGTCGAALGIALRYWEAHRSLLQTHWNDSVAPEAVMARKAGWFDAASDSWLGRFSLLSGSFARGVQLAANGLPEPSLVIAHDDLALEAVTGISTDTTVTVFDNIEHPDHASRPHVAGSVRAKASAADQAAVNAYKVAAVNAIDAIFATSQGQADALVAMGVDTPVVLLRNAQDVGNRSSRNIRTDAGLSAQDVLVVYLNNVYTGAGHAECVQAMAHTDSTVHLAFLGQHRTTELSPTALAAQTLEVAAASRVHELSTVPAAELIDYIASADAVVIPLSDAHENHRTCLPNRVFQAVTAQVPIIAHANTEIGTFVGEHALGPVVESLAPQELGAAFALAGSLKDSCADALAAAAKQFTWDREQQVIVSLVEQSCPNRSAAFIVVNKPIDRHTRTARLCRTLLELFDEVHVLAYALPPEALAVPGVRYHEIESALGRIELLQS